MLIQMTVIKIQTTGIQIQMKNKMTEKVMETRKNTNGNEKRNQRQSSKH